MKVTVDDFEERKAQFLFSILQLEDIHPDQLGLYRYQLCTCVNWVLALDGSRRIKIAGVNDKRQIVLAFAGTISGKSEKC